MPYQNACWLLALLTDLAKQKMIQVFGFLFLHPGCKLQAGSSYCPILPYGLLFKRPGQLLLRKAIGGTAPFHRLLYLWQENESLSSAKVFGSIPGKKLTGSVNQVAYTCAYTGYSSVWGGCYENSGDHPHETWCLAEVGLPVTTLPALH